MRTLHTRGGIGDRTAYYALLTYLPSNVSIKIYAFHPTPKTTTSLIAGGIGVFPNSFRALNAISPASVIYLRAHDNASSYFVIRNQHWTMLGRL
ncbi:hypothetical protein EDD18DRAFT_1051566, partial [Armillaria luteobubalina]